MNTDGKNIKAHLRLKEHAYSEEKQVIEKYRDSVKNIPETPQATLQLCSRKYKMMTKRTRSQKSCNVSETEQGTSAGEAIAPA